jgi:hypothetical protein
VSTTARVLLGAALFALLVGTIYWFLSYEAAGTIMLLTMAAGLVIAAAYLSLLGRRASVPADRREARPTDSAGESVGIFAARSAWPAVLALGCAVGLTGLIYGWWLAVVGAAGVTISLIGLVRDDRAARSR